MKKIEYKRMVKKENQWFCMDRAWLVEYGNIHSGLKDKFTMICACDFMCVYLYMLNVSVVHFSRNTL